MPELISKEERQKQFLDIFTGFQSIGEAAKWISDKTGYSVQTVMAWRCKGKGGYPIPARPFKMIMDAMAARPTAQ